MMEYAVYINQHMNCIENSFVQFSISVLQNCIGGVSSIHVFKQKGLIQ